MKGLISVGKLSCFIPYHHVESPWRNSCQRLQPYSVSSTGVVVLSCKVYFYVPYTIIFAAGFNAFTKSRILIRLAFVCSHSQKSDELILHKIFSLTLKDRTKLLKIKKQTNKQTNKETKANEKIKKTETKTNTKVTLQTVVRDDPLDLTGLHKFRLYTAMIFFAF